MHLSNGGGGEEYDYQAGLHPISIVNVQPLKEDNSFYGIPWQQEEYDDQRIDEDLAKAIHEKFWKLHELESSLNHIKRLWDSGQHPNERYPIEYYLEWAEKKSITVPWLDWAKKNNLLKIKKRASKSLDKRSETTYLNIIAALLEVIIGKSPGLKKPPVFNSEAELIDHLKEIPARGISKTTLELKFAEAKRVFREF